MATQVPQVTVGRGHAKAIVVGEHHVMTGAYALAVALPRLTTQLTLHRQGNGALQLHWPLEDLPQTAADEARALVLCILTALGVRGRVAIRADCTVPIGRGLGSSAALAVACARAGAASLQLNLTSEEIQEIAKQGEHVVHGRSSGLDPAAAAAERGAVLFHQGKIVEEITVHPSLASAHWWLLDLGQRSTRQAIETAQLHRQQAGPSAVEAWTEETSNAARRAAQAMAEGDLAALAQSMNTAHELLEPLGVVHPAMRQVVTMCRQGGALAVKQTGAGLGGMMLALLPNAALASPLSQKLLPLVTHHWLLPLALSPEDS